MTVRFEEISYDADHKKYPGRVIYGSENSKDAKAWLYVRNNDYICGQFLWTGIDFLGECRGWPSRISQAGLIDLAGFEKPGYYHRKAMWTDEPFVKIAVGHEDDKWNGPESETFFWNDEAGRMMRVSIYTNQAECELFLNGKSLGKKETEDDFRSVWMVPFEKGELTARSHDAKDQIKTSEKAESILLAPDKNTLSKHAQSIAQIEVFLLDANKNPAASDEEIHFQITGDAEIIGIENGKCDDLTPYFDKYRTTHLSRAIVYVRSGIMEGEITLHAFTRSGLYAKAHLHQA